MTYFIIFLIFLYPIIKGASIKNNVHRSYYKIMCIILIMVAGFRNTVGGDTMGYMADWEYRVPTLNSLNAVDILYMSQFYRPLIMSLWIICKTIWQEFYCIQLVTSIIVNVSAFYIIQRESRYKYEAAMLFLLFQYFYFNMEIMRESVAVSLFYFALILFDQKKWKSYYLLLLITFFIHDSCILFFLLPLANRIIEKKPAFKTYLLVIICGMVIFNPIVFKYFLNFMPGNRGKEFMEGYGAMENATIFGTIRSFLVIFLNIFILNKIHNTQTSLANKGFAIYILLSCFGLAMPIISTRIRNYVTIFSLICYAQFLVEYKKEIAQKILILLLMFNFYRYYFLNVSDWVGRDAEIGKYYFYELFYPYTSIFEDPDPNVVTRRNAIYNQAGTKE